MKKQQKCLVLFIGLIDSEDAVPIAAFLNKKTLRDYVCKEFPDARSIKRQWKNEMYWERRVEWLRCRAITDEIPLILETK